MDLEKLQNSYQNISREELERMWRFGYYEGSMKMLNWRREKMKVRGREHVLSVPLVQVLSVHVILDKVDENKPLAIYGRIYGEYDHITNGNERSSHNVYNRGCDEPEIISQNGNLTLTGPTASCSQFDVCMPLHKTTIVVNLWDADQNVVFSQGSFLVEEIAENEYEQVKLKVFPSMSGYVIGHKKEGNRDVVNVNGKIVIRYDNTYGNYSSEEYTIFEKPNFEFEPLEVNSHGSLRQSRYWIGVPAYSSVLVDFDLWDFDTKRNILKETVKFPTQRWCVGYIHTLTIDDLAIDMHMHNYKLYSEEVSKKENDDESAVMYSDDESSFCWIIYAGMELTTTTLMEFYSVFIGHEKHKALRIFGVIEVSSCGHTFDIFRRQENNAIELLEDETSLPILDGNREYDFSHSIKIMFDLKDVDGRVFINGFVKWRKDEVESSWRDDQLCSVIPGEHGFAAVHYTFFVGALQANMEVFYKTENSCNVIYGSLVAQFDKGDYSSRYKRDYYRTVLFQRNHQDPLEVPSDMKLPLSRSVVVVPKTATLIIQVDLWSVGLNKCLSHVFEIQMGCPSISINKEQFSLHINVKWSEGRRMLNSNNQ